METALHRELHAGKQNKGPEAWPGLLLHSLVSSLQGIDPFAAVVIGDGDAVDTGSHELAQPALGCHLLVCADGLVPVGGIGGGWRVSVEVEGPPASAGVGPGGWTRRGGKGSHGTGWAGGERVWIRHGSDHRCECPSRRYFCSRLLGISGKV